MYHLEGSVFILSSPEIKKAIGIDPDTYTNLDMLNTFGVYPYVEVTVPSVKFDFYDVNVSGFTINENRAYRNYNFTLKDLSGVQTGAKKLLKAKFENDVATAAIGDIDGLNTQLQSDIQTVDNTTDVPTVVSFAEPDFAFAINGYYPLYETATEANDAGDGSSHTHVIDGVTYYMPNGVDVYHGTYEVNNPSAVPYSS